MPPIYACKLADPVSRGRKTASRMLCKLWCTRVGCAATRNSDAVKGRLIACSKPHPEAGSIVSLSHACHMGVLV